MSQSKWCGSTRNMPPCGKCPDKKIACSDHCQKPEYLAWKEEQARIAKARNDMRTCDSYTSDQIRKNRRK